MGAGAIWKRGRDGDVQRKVELGKDGERMEGGWRRGTAEQREALENGARAKI